MVNWQKNDWNVFDIPEGIKLGYLNKNMMTYYDQARALENRSRSYPNRQINELTFKARGGSSAQWDKIIKREDQNRALSKRQSASIKAAAAIQKQQSKPKPASKPAPKPTKQNTFVTGSGSVNVFKGGKEISPATKEGTAIQDIFDRQAAQREINKEQKKLFDRVTGATDYKQAFNIQEKSRTINPNVGTFQQAFRDGALKETRGVKGLGDRTVTKTDFFGNPVSDYKQTFLVDDTGKRLASIDSQSRGSEFDFFKTPKTQQRSTAVYGPPAQASTFDFFNLGSGSGEKKRQSDNNYLKDDEKAFFFFPDVPQGDDFLSQFGRGVTKGASNTLAGVWNVGLMAGSGIQQATGGKPIPEKDFVPFYSTPVTNVESGFFDAAAGTGKSFFTGEKYDAKKRVQTGFDEAYDNFFSKPVESAGSLVELVPYFGFGAAKAGVRAAGDFFGSLGKTTTKGSTGPKKTGNFVQDFFYEKPDKSTIFNLDTASTFSSKNVKTGSGPTQFFDTSAKGTGKTTGKTGPDDFFKATTKTKGGGTYTKKSWTDDFMGGKPIQSGSSFLIQKTKLKQKTKTQVKQQNKLVDQFFKPMQKQKTKTKTKQKQKVKQKQDFFTAFIPKLSPKQKQRQESALTPKLSQKQKTAQPAKQKQTTDFFAGTALKTGQKKPTPTKLKTMGGGFWWGFIGGGGRGSRTKRNKRGDKSFTAWNVDESKVGSFFAGPSYRTSKSTRVFKDADARNKRAAKKQRKKNKDFVTGFFD